jgi:hypothetical protein
MKIYVAIVESFMKRERDRTKLSFVNFNPLFVLMFFSCKRFFLIHLMYNQIQGLGVMYSLLYGYL